MLASNQPDDNGNQIGQAQQSVAIAFGHSLKIRATKLTCEWIFSSKTETLWRLRLIIIIISPTFLAFQRHHLHYSPSSKHIRPGQAAAIAEVEYTPHTSRYAMKTKPRYTRTTTIIINVILHCQAGSVVRTWCTLNIGNRKHLSYNSDFASAPAQLETRKSSGKHNHDHRRDAILCRLWFIGRNATKCS